MLKYPRLLDTRTSTSDQIGTIHNTFAKMMWKEIGFCRIVGSSEQRQYRKTKADACYFTILAVPSAGGHDDDAPPIQPNRAGHACPDRACHDARYLPLEWRWGQLPYRPTVLR